MITTAVLDFIIGKVLGGVLKAIMWPWRKFRSRNAPSPTRHPAPMFDVGALGEGELTRNRSEGGILRADKVDRLRARDNVSGAPRDADA